MSRPSKVRYNIMMSTIDVSISDSMAVNEQI